jgi:hypothetical protein
MTSFKQQFSKWVTRKNTFNMDVIKYRTHKSTNGIIHHYFTCLHRKFGQGPKNDPEVHHLEFSPFSHSFLPSTKIQLETCTNATKIQAGKGLHLGEGKVGGGGVKNRDKRGGGCTRGTRGRGRLGFGGGERSGLPTTGSRSTAQNQSHACSRPPRTRQTKILLLLMYAP